MQRKSFFLLITLLCILFTSSLLFGQIQENLEIYSQTNAEGYIKPIVDCLGVNMNRGWYHSAKIPKFGLKFRFGLVAMLAPFMDKDKTFTATTEGTFKPRTDAEVSTVAGSEKSVEIKGTGETTFAFPGGLNMTGIPFVAPQLTVGYFMGTEATLRLFDTAWLGKMGDTEIGDISLFGIGVRHSIDQYIPLCPVDIAAGVFYQRISVSDDFIKFTNLHIGVQASKGLGPLLVYGGLGYDNSNATMEWSYHGEFGDFEYSVDIAGDNGIEATAGLGFNVFILHLNADISFGRRLAYSAGLHFGL